MCFFAENTRRTGRAHGYCWRSFHKAENVYDIYHTECGAVVWASLLLKFFLKGCRFLSKLITTRFGTYWTCWTLQENWWMAGVFVEVEFMVIHWDSIKHQAANELSGSLTTWLDESSLDNHEHVLMITKEKSEDRVDALQRKMSCSLPCTDGMDSV